MAKDAVEMSGTVIDAMPGSFFKVELSNGKIVKASISGKIRMNSIRIVTGDKVTVEVSVYDPTQGRITYRER